MTDVSSTSTVVSNVVTYNATIALVSPPADVKEGMTANVAVVTETRAHVLELSSSAITTNGTLSTVQLVANGKTTVTRIQTGLVGDSSTEIVSGVSAGDLVAIPTVTVAAASENRHRHRCGRRCRDLRGRWRRLRRRRVRAGRKR